MRMVCLGLLAGSFLTPLHAEGFGTSTVSFGAGVAVPAAGYRTFSFANGPTVHGEFEFRLHRFVAANVGVDTFFLNYTNITRSSSFLTRERLTLAPFGLRGIVPLGRAELFAGIGGAPIWGSQTALGYQGNSMLVHLNAGARVALDRRKRVHAGATMRFYRDAGSPTQQWVSLAGEIGFRFLR